MREAYLDIETTGLSCLDDAITVIGIYLTDGFHSQFIQLVGEEATRKSLMEILSDVDILYTYNGSRFDLPFIETALEVDLARHCQHHDLMWDCWKNNLYGGFKAVESQLGIVRKLKGIDGREAVRLWWMYQKNQQKEALDTLLSYNKEDVMNLKVLRDILAVYSP
ncbi:MAG: ribonuclease H-like domain-containing protein [Chloroflexi bacterium]|nr:ribonuclease H-like domain-containing protein [Chloroflexota bacterium]